MQTKLAIHFLAPVLFFLLLACAEDPVVGNDPADIGHTLTLRLSATVSPLFDTEALVRPSAPGSEAASAGFDYEIVSSSAADSISFSLATKAPTTLKNVYALLFTSDGAFNGRASIGTITADSDIDITFTNVGSPTASSCRLVIVANDNAATTSYSSSGGTGGFASFTGTYAAFQALTITSGISVDADVPYAGSATVDLSQGATGVTTTIPLYRTLAKITLKNTFRITGGPARSSITLNNAGVRRFAPSGSNDYNGAGTTEPSDFVATTSNNDDENVWYVGENTRPTVSSVSTSADRNSSKAPKAACYIRIGSDTQSIAANTKPSVGEEYIVSSGSRSFTYDIYLGKSSDVSDFSLRRHTNYTLTTSVGGTLSGQEELAVSDGRVTLTKTGGESAGLCIGLLGGALDYTTGSGSFPAISGRYAKNLLLQPNTSGTTAADNKANLWSTATTTPLQSETRKYWDPTYTLASNNIDKSSGLAYDYCYNLTLGGVSPGTWYLPTQLQLAVIYVVLKGNSAFAGYSAFTAHGYWSSTEYSADNAWYMGFATGNTGSYLKTGYYRVRCVRDL